MMWRLSLFICYACLSACALSPLQILPEPKAAFGLPEVSPTLSFQVSVESHLPDNLVVGSRGGVYQHSSLIRLAPSYTAALTKSIRFSLVGMGLVPRQQLMNVDVGSEQASDLQVRLVLKNLKSTCPSPLLPNTLEQSIEIEWQLDKSGRRYQQDFSRTATRHFARLPSAQDHRQAIELLLEQVLLQAYRSPAALAFMRQ